MTRASNTSRKKSLYEGDGETTQAEASMRDRRRVIDPRGMPDQITRVQGSDPEVPADWLKDMKNRVLRGQAEVEESRNFYSGVISFLISRQ